MKHAITLITLALLLGSCGRQLSATSDTKAVHTTSDSVRIVERLVSVPYAVPGDTTRVFLPVDCDSLGRLRAAGLSSSGTRASVHVEYVPATATSHQGLEIEADCNAYIDSLHISQQSVTELRQRYDSLATFKSQTIQVKYIPAVYKWALWLWVVLLVAAVVFTAVKLYLKFKP